GSDDRRGRVRRRVVGIDQRGLRRRRGVVGRPLCDPVGDELHLGGGERVAALGHLGLGVGVALDLVGDEALAGLAGDDAGLGALAHFEQLGVVGHDIRAAGLGGLVAAVAVLGEDRPHVLVVADLAGGGLRLLGRVGGQPDVSGE